MLLKSKGLIYGMDLGSTGSGAYAGVVQRHDNFEKIGYRCGGICLLIKINKYIFIYIFYILLSIFFFSYNGKHIPI